MSDPEFLISSKVKPILLAGGPSFEKHGYMSPAQKRRRGSDTRHSVFGGTDRALTRVREGSMTLVGRFPGPPEPRATPRSGRTASWLDARSQQQRGHNAQRTRQPGCVTKRRGGGRTPDP